MALPIILLAAIIALLIRDMVKKEIDHIKDSSYISIIDDKLKYTPEFQDPYEEYDAYDDSFEESLDEFEK